MCSTRSTINSAAMPIGTFTRKTQRQPTMPRMVLVPAKKPPTSGPMTEDMPNTARK